MPFDILYVVYPLSAILMIGMPIALGVVLARKTGAKWALFGIGAVTFIGSQVVHIPLNYGLTLFFKSIWPSPQPQPWHTPFNAVVLGLSAGLCEETARYVGYRWLAPRARSFRDGLMMGAGHGGTEAIILGLLAGASFVSLAQARNIDLTAQGLTGETLKQAQAQIAAYWSAPWYLGLVGAVERVFALAVHIILSVMVLQVFVRRNWMWLVVAIGYHALVDGVAVYELQSQWSIAAIEGSVAILAVAGLVIVWALWPRREGLSPSDPDPVLVPGASSAPRSDEQRERASYDRIEKSRFT